MLSYIKNIVFFFKTLFFPEYWDGEAHEGATYISQQRFGVTGDGGKADEFGRVCGCNHRGVPHSWYRVNERETPGPGAEGGA